MRNHLLKSIFISLILAMGVSNAWAASEGSSWYDWASSENVYFDNTNSSYTDVSMLIGRQWTYGGDGIGSSGVNFTKVDNTNNLYHAAATWNHYNTLLFIDAKDWGWEGDKKVTQRYSYASNYTNTNNVNINGTELFYAASSTKGATLNHQDLTSYTALNYTQTVQQHLSTDGGSNYSASTTALATVKVSSYKLKSKNATESSSGTIASSSSSANCSAARTATVTYTVSGVKAGYTFVGWYDGTTQKSTSTTYTYNATAAKTITARFKENTYTVTVKNDEHGTTTPSGAQSNVGQVTGLSIKATPAANYEFVNWTITSGSGSFGSATSASTTFKPTSAATIQANFRSTATYSLTVVAGANIESVTGSTDPVTLGNTYNITATPKTGYTFSTWTANPAANATFGSETTANTTVTVKNGSVTVSASATENMSTLTTSNKYDAGDPGYEVPTASVNSIGYETIAEVTAAAAGNGYTFTGWTLTNCTRTDGGADDATSITVRSNGDGEAATVTANYTEVLTTGWYLAGEFSNKDDKDTGWKTDKIEFKKLSGESSGTVSYITLDLLPTTFTDEYNMSFKLVNGDWYGNDGEYKKANDKQDWQFETGKGNCNLDVSLPGTYTFCLNTNKDGKVYLNIAYPVVNQLQVYSADPAHSEAIANWEWDIKTGDKYSKTLTLNEETKYTFKAVVNSEFYGKSTTLKRSSSSAVLNTSDGDVTLATDIAGDYKFEFNASTKELSVDYPVSNYDYYISGSVNDWAKYDNAYGMAKNANTYEKTLTSLQAGDYTFKVHQLAGDWYGWDNIDNTDFIELSNDEGNIKLTLTNTTDVTIKFDSNTKKISFEGLTAVTYSDITIKAYTESAAPQIWWWNGGSKCPDADKTDNPSNPGNKYTWETAPTMTAVAGEANWYEYTFKDVNDQTGICFKFKNATTASGNFEGIKADACYDVRDVTNAKTTACGITPSDCIECSGIYLKGTFNDWGTDHEFMKTADADVVTTTVTITQEGNYNFKVHATDWLGNDGGTMARGGSGVETGGWTMEKEKNEVTLAADMEGDYIFTYTISTKKLAITFPVVVPQSFPNQPTTLYFHPSSEWKKGNERYAAYIYNNGADKEWINLTDANNDGIYELANPQKYAKVIICRMDKTKAENNWENKWDQIESGIEIPNTATLNTCLAFWTNCKENVPVSECTWVAPTPLTDKNWDAFIAAYNGKTINALVERSFKHSQYHTLCLPFDIPTNWLGDGTTAYQLTSIVANNTGDKLSLNATKWNTIVAGQPYIIVPVKGSEYEHVIINNVTVQNVSAGTSVASGAGYKATLKAVTTTDGTKTNGSTEYYVGANDGKLYNAQTNKLGLRAIIELTTTGGQPLPPKVRAHVATGENVETGVEDIITNGENTTIKLIANGQLIIIRDGVKYNAQGVRL